MARTTSTLRTGALVPMVNWTVPRWPAPSPGRPAAVPFLAPIARQLDSSRWLNAPLGWLRLRLPGDPRYGDPLSISASDPVGRLTRLLSVAPEHSAFKQSGLTGLQLWRWAAPAWLGGDEPTERDAGPGETEPVTMMFTDLSGFSTWTLLIGDQAMVEVLREISTRIEPLLCEHGRIVKRLGDGLMVVFDDARAATLAAIRCRDLTAELSAQGPGPRHGMQLRVGVHTGRPVALGGDYFGQDVNTAARLAQQARPGQVLISNTTREHLPISWPTREVPMRAKGVPPHVRAYQITTTQPAATHHPPLRLLESRTG